ncbi:MAG: T9SS type A sorting domain-containing protein [Lewinellaceae bacterium]|nr:T9SS type A sorting domain-containing protein [Lewinellaceae bacterium]
MRLFLLFSLMLLGMFSSAALIGQTATVHVQDDAATAIVGASVTLNTTIVLTDDSGDAIFAGLADGDYAYTVTADCYVAGAGVITIAGADNSDTTVLSLSTSNDLFINLLPPGGFGFPPSGVTVRLYNDDLSYDETLVTGGFTVFSNVPYGTYNYTLSQDCKQTVTGTTTVECTPGDIDALVAEFGVNQTTNDLFINLVPPGGFGFPPSGVTVRLYNDDLSYDETLVTGGFTVFSNVPYGTYNYTLSQDCKETVEGTTTVECTPGDIDALVAEFGVNQTTNDLFINLVPPGGFGFPPTGVTVRLYNDDLSYDETLVTGGFTVFTDVPYGTYNYTLSQDCKETVEGTTTVECTPGDIDALVAEFGVNQTTNDLFINLVPPGGFGFPPSGVTVRLYNDDLSYDETLVTGGFTVFTDVPYGTYNYTLSQDCKQTVTGTTTVECTPGDIDALVAEFGINQTTNDLFINLVPPGGFGFPPTGVTVRLYNDDLSYDETLVTGGFTVFSNVPYGTYNYTLSQDCKETVEGTTTVECTPGDIDALVAEFGINQTTNDLFINLVPPGGFGFPPSGVTVRLYNDDLSYDETLVTGGFTVFSNVPYGTYNYTLSQDCKQTVTGTTTVECTPGDIDALVAEFGINQTTNDLFINLVPPGGFGFPPSGVTVRLYNDDLSYDQTLVTGGFTVFTDVPYGTYNYTLSQDCKQTVTGTTTVECTPGDIDALVAEFGVNQTTNDLFINLVPPGGFGFPPTGVTVRLYNDDLSYDETLVTGGFTVFSNVPYGTYNYTLSKNCKQTVTGTTTVECTPGDIDALVAEFGLNQTTNGLLFQILPIGGFDIAINNASIRVWNDDLTVDQTITSSDYNLFPDLPFGTYNYSVTKDCYATVTGTTTVDCAIDVDGNPEYNSQVVELTLITTPSTINSLVFYVLPPGGLGFGINGASIRVWNDDFTVDQTIISSGYNLFADLPYGNYHYSVSKDCNVTVTGITIVDCAVDVDGNPDFVSQVVELGPTTTNNVFFFVGNFFQEPDCTITVTNTETFEQTSITGQNILGDYIVENLPYGTYNYTVSKDCFVSQTGQVVVDCQPNDGEGNQLGNAVFLGDMVPNTTNNVFFFVGNFFQEPDCTITVTNTETFEQTSITGLDILGSYVVENLPYGTYNYTVSKDCFVSQTGQVVVDCQPNDGEGNQLGNAVFLGDMVPNTTNNVFFFVGNFFQEPDCTITVTNTETFEQTSITGLDILGSYVVENLPYGTYNYTVSKDCFVSQTGQVVVDCQPNDGEGNQLGNTVFLGDMVPNTTNNVFFFVGNFFNEPDCTITVTNTETFEQTSITGLDILGSYVVENLPYGTYNYTVSKDCFVSQTGQVVVDCQPNDNQGNPQGNVVFLGDMVPNTTNNVFFFVGNFFNEPDCTITVTNTETSEQTSITGLDILGSYVVENLPYGTYNYTVSKDCFVSQTGQVVVDCQPNDNQGNPQGNVVSLGDMVPITVDNSVTQVDGTLTANATGLTYQWTLCDGTEIEGETNASFTPTVTGDYAVVVTDGNCSSTSECITVMVNGTTSLNAGDLSFYPNPVQDELTIDFEKMVSDVKVRVFNINGQLMFTQDFPETEMIKLDMSKLIPGTYMLDLTVKGESLKTSIIKM